MRVLDTGCLYIAFIQYLYPATNLALHQDVLHIFCRFCNVHHYTFRQLDNASIAPYIRAPCTARLVLIVGMPTVIVSAKPSFSWICRHLVGIGLENAALSCCDVSRACPEKNFYIDLSDENYSSRIEQKNTYCRAIEDADSLFLLVVCW